MTIQSQIFKTVPAMLGLLCASSLLPVSAQVVPNPAMEKGAQVAPLATRQLVTIPLRFMPARLMAYWLDPEHAPIPHEITESQAVMGPPFKDDNPPAKPSKNTDWVWPDDGANQLLVYGTPQWIDKVRETAKMLDARAPLLSVGTRMVRMTARECQALGIDNQGNAPTPGTSLLFAKPTVEKLERLIAQGSITIEGSSERVLVNNLASSLLKSSDPLPPEIAALAPQGVHTNVYNVNGTPTINNDSTVTFVLNLSKNADQGKFAVQVIAIARDTDTIALFLNDNDPNDQLVLLLSPHILRVKSDA